MGWAAVVTKAVDMFAHDGVPVEASVQQVLVEHPVVLSETATRQVAVMASKVSHVEYRSSTSSRVYMDNGRPVDVLGTVQQVVDLLFG